MRANRLQRTMFPGLIVALVPLTIPTSGLTQDSQQTLNETVSAQVRIDTDSASSQLRISQLADDTTDLLAQFRLTTQQLDRLSQGLLRILRESGRGKKSAAQEPQSGPGTKSAVSG